MFWRSFTQTLRRFDFPLLFFLPMRSRSLQQPLTFLFLVLVGLLLFTQLPNFLNKTSATSSSPSSPTSNQVSSLNSSQTPSPNSNLSSATATPSNPLSDPGSSAVALATPPPADVIKPTATGTTSRQPSEKPSSPQGSPSAIQPSPQIVETTVAKDQTVEQPSLYGHFPYTEAKSSELVAVGDGSVLLHFEAAAAYGQMVQAARADGISLVPISGFRDTQLQTELFEAQTVRRGSKTAAAKISAPPGHSEHHTGYAIDLGDGQYPQTDVEVSFEQTPAFNWLRQRASQFGFELSFPQGNAQGVSYEPWHWRFVVSPQASQVFSQR
jgi:zinc D-Ala-D-Ala carboxypeptidase